jgi:1-phosphatidylinositol phosphodiesterase
MMLCFLVTVWVLSLSPWLALGSPVLIDIEPYAPTSLAEFALQKVLQDASPIFGYYVENYSPTAEWMKEYPDSTPLVDMNLPGVHDTQTWNYSLATQEALAGVAAIGGNVIYPPQIYRCQNQSIITMLNAGIRVFDLRVAYDPTNSTLVFWHSSALQSETATMEDVLIGYYKWLDDHPSETIMLSFNYEGSTTKYARNNAAVQLAMFNALMNPAAKKYFLQTQNEFGTLGASRGRIILLRRFSLDALPTSYSDAMPGKYFPASQWHDDDPDIALVYNSSRNLTAYIEDFYEPDQAPTGSGAAYNIALKFNATIAHLSKATEPQYNDSLFWTFASAEHNADTPSEYPEIMALGDGEQTPLGGVNQQLVPFLKEMKGKRVGIVMFDFFDTPGDLVDTLLSLRSP